MSDTVKMQYARIINRDTHEVQIGVGCDVAYYIEIGMEFMETELAYNGNWYEKGWAPQEEKKKPTKEEIRKIRESLYVSEIDPLTLQIQRLRDEVQSDRVKKEIAELIQKRSYLVSRIRIDNPYPGEV